MTDNLKFQISNLKNYPKKVLVAIIAIIIVIGLIVYFLWQTKEAEEEIKIEEREETIEDLLRSMAPSNQEPMTEEEQEKTKEELRQMTPVESRPMTGEERREAGEMLRQMMSQ